MTELDRSWIAHGPHIEAFKGITTDGEQQTKTKTALEFFSAELHSLPS